MRNIELENQCLQAYNCILETKEAERKLELRQSLERIEEIFGKIEVIKTPTVNFLGYVGELTYDGIILKSSYGRMFVIKDRIDFGKYLSRVRENERILVNE